MRDFIAVRLFKEEKYADSLLNGNVHMNCLYSYGPRNYAEKNKDEKRIDFYEGSVGFYVNGDECPFFKDFPDFFRKNIKHCWIPDDDLLQYRIYCMYCLEYENGEPIRPKESIKSLGDYVVVISDFDEFVKRLCNKFALEWNERHILKAYLNKMSYYNLSKSKRLLPLFEKDERYADENEIRIAFAKIYVMFDEKIKQYYLDVDKTKDPYDFDIGDISDIAFKMKTEDFINLNFPKNFTPKFGNTPKILEFIEKTKKDLENYQPKRLRPIIYI